MDNWAWDSKNLEKHQINQKNQKNQSWMDLPKILLTGLFFLFFLVFLEFLDSWAWDSKNLEKNQINHKKQKNQSWMDLPKILLTGLVFLFFLFFLVFLEFLDNWVWDSKILEKNQINQKKQKTNPEWTYPRFFSQDWFFCFFCFFWFSSRFWTIGLGTTKNLNKNKKILYTKTILNGLAQDSSHRIDFSVLI